MLNHETFVKLRDLHKQRGRHINRSQDARIRCQPIVGRQ